MREWVSSLALRLRALLRRRQLERDFRDELAFHVAMREEQLRTAGAVEAEVRARQRFGNTTRIREDLRDVWALAPGLGALGRDFRYGARTLRRSSAFSLVVILTLGLGIGANTAFFTVVNAVLVRPLGYLEADRLVLLHEAFPRAGIDRLPFSALDFDDLRRDQQSFETVAAYRNVPFELSGDGPPERVAGAKVSAELFDVLGVGPIGGHLFSPAEDRPGVNVAVLSWGLWQRRYAAEPSVIGRGIQLDRQPYTVVAIMPAGFVFPQRGPRFNAEAADVWVPRAFTQRERLERGSQHVNSVIGKLKAGVSLEAAQAELDVIAERIGASYRPGARRAGFSPRLFAQPLREEISGRLQTSLLMLQAAVGLVLLVACANIANLVLGRMATRTQEFAVRTALGARRPQLIRLLVTEALLLSVSGAAVGIAIAYWGIKATPAVLARTMPGLHELTIDVRVLAFTAVMCFGTAMVIALISLPALDRRDPGRALRDDLPRATAGVRGLQLQRRLVVITVTLATILLVGAGLFIRSFVALAKTDPGFRAAQVLTASMTLPRTFYATGASVRTFQDSLTRSLLSLPGVRTVALATDLPLTTYEIRAFTPDGGRFQDDAGPTTHISWVHGPYFETLGITLRRGRFFTPDEHAANRGVVIVNEKLAALAWPDQDPIGKRLKWGAASSQSPWLTVVGLIRNVADGPIGADPGVHAYEPFQQLPDVFLDSVPNQFGRDVKAVVLAAGEPRALAELVRQAISKLDPELAVESITPMDERVSDVVAPRRFGTLIVGVFAAMALLLASVGLYGLLAFTSAQRRKEIAVRIALGAERRSVIAMVTAQGARLVGAGLVFGLLSSLAFSRLVASLLYHTSPYDYLAFASIPAVLLPAALLACAIPAWRAARTEPTAALRAE